MISTTMNVPFNQVSQSIKIESKKNDAFYVPNFFSEKSINNDMVKKTSKKQLEQKIEKAKEYIKSYLPNYDFDHTNLKKILEILEGEDYVN